MTELRFSPGDVIAGRYEVCALLGRGGMGAVYQAKDKELRDTQVALKLLHTELAEDATEFERFRNEVLIARELTHPNIVRIHDLQKAPEGFYYISMEFVDGASLKSYLKTHNSLSFPELLALYCQVLAGAAEAHRKGVVHRDLKPDNIIVAKEGELKLVDFGISRLMEQNLQLTKTGHSVGTPSYMSPEQIRGGHLDARSDVYALGIIGYQLVSGKLPFTATSYVEVAYKHIEQPLPDFPAEKTDVPQWFKEIVRKASAKKPEDRYSDAGEMLNVIKAQQNPESEATVLMERPKKPGISGLLIASIVVLAMAGAAGLWFMYNAKQPLIGVDEKSSVPQQLPVEVSSPVETSTPDATEILPEEDIKKAEQKPVEPPVQKPEPVDVPVEIPVDESPDETPATQTDAVAIDPREGIPVEEQKPVDNSVQVQDEQQPASPAVDDDVQIYVLKIGESVPREAFAVSEFGDLRWVASLGWDHAAADLAKQGRCLVQLIKLEQGQVVATTKASVFSQGSRSNRELRMTDNFTQTGSGSMLPGEYQVVFSCNDEQLSKLQIVLR